MKLAFCLNKYLPENDTQCELKGIVSEALHRGYQVDIFVMEWKIAIPSGFNVIVVSMKGYTQQQRIKNFSKYVREVVKNAGYDLVVGFNQVHSADIYISANFLLNYSKPHSHRHNNNDANHLSFPNLILNTLEKMAQKKPPELITLQKKHGCQGKSIKLERSLLTCWPQSDMFPAIMQTSGMTYRAIEKRKTLKFEHQGHSYFIKQHFGAGWLEIFKNLVVGKLPIIGAKNEYEALNHLSALGIQAPHIVGYGEHGCNPATKQSFLITREVTSALSLDKLEADWHSNRLSWGLKQHLLKQVAFIAATLHQNGINHRDFYACHFMIQDPLTEESDVTLMDLHRAQIRVRTPKRWIVKDLASLYYSILNFNLTKRDILRFMQYYSMQSWKVQLTDNLTFWQTVKERSKRFIKRHDRFFSSPINAGKNL